MKKTLLESEYITGSELAISFLLGVWMGYLWQGILIDSILFGGVVLVLFVTNFRVLRALKN